VELINPPGNATALIVTPADGSNTHANAQTLVIKTAIVLIPGYNHQSE
jgi:hypothetical protein